MSQTPGLVIVGLGWGVKFQVPCFRNAGWNIVGLVGRKADKTKEIAEALGIPIASTNIDELLTRDDVHLFSIVTPPSTHHNYVIKIIKAGKNVLTEKPFALSLREALEMRDALPSINPPLAFVDHELRVLNSVQTIKRYVSDKDKMGIIGHIHLLSVGPLSVSPHYNWWCERKEAGGILNAVGTHMLDLIHYVTSCNIHSVSALLASVNKTKQDEEGKSHQVTSDDYASIHLKATTPTTNQPFPISITLNGTVQGLSKKELLISGSKGSILFEFDALTATYYSPDRTATVISSRDTDDFDSTVIPVAKNAFSAGTVKIAAVLKNRVTRGNNADRSGDIELADFNDGVWVQRVIDASLESHDKGGDWIEITNK